MTLLDQISDALGASGALGELSNTLGASASETDSLLSAGLPAVLGGLGAQTGGDGMAALMGLVSGGGDDLISNLGSFFTHGDKTGLASKLVGSLFGSQRSAVESHVASESGGALSLVSRMLPMLAPAVMGFLGKIIKDDSLDAESLGEKLAGIGAAGPLGDVLAAQTDEDRAGFVDGIASVRDAGGLAALVPATTASVVPVTAAAGTAASGAVSAGALTSMDAHPDEDRDRNGLGWIPFFTLLVAGLITGLVLWQCADVNNAASDSEDPAIEVASEAESVEDAVEEPVAEPTATPEPEPTAAPEATAEPTPEPTPEPVAAPAVTIADLAAGNPDLSTLVTVGLTSDLLDQLADPEAGPFTVFAPTNDAFAGAGDVLERLDQDQTQTTVSFHVVPELVTSADLTPGATFDTLAGETLTVGDDGTLTGGVMVTSADNEADNGIVHIVENVLVPGSIRRSLAAEDVNQAFQLNPIQFASGSAEILPESQVTLDEAIVTLTSLPAGAKFEVQGHTDTQGDGDFNQVLSEDRATAVVAYLVDGGVDPDMLEAQGYGETDLKIDPEETDEHRAQNRRIEFEDISDQ